MTSSADDTYLYGDASTALAQYNLSTRSVDYLHSDLLGSIRTTTNISGTVTSNADYETYGYTGGKPLQLTELTGVTDGTDQT